MSEAVIEVHLPPACTSATHNPRCAPTPGATEICDEVTGRPENPWWLFFMQVYGTAVKLR